MPSELLPHIPPAMIKEPAPITAPSVVDRDGWVISRGLEANLVTANPSSVPDRHRRGTIDTEINGRAPQLPHPHGLGENHDHHTDHSHGDAHHVTDDSDGPTYKYAFDTLMADPRSINPEAITRRIPRTFLGRIALRRQIKKIEVKLPQAERFAATMWHYGDTTLRRQSAGVSFDRGTHSESGVTKSKWYAKALEQANPDLVGRMSGEAMSKVENFNRKGIKAPNLTASTDKEATEIRKMVVLNEKGNNARREGQKLTINVAPLLGQELPPKEARNKSALAYLAAEERSHGSHMLHEQIDMIRKPAEEVQAMKQKREELKARLAAVELRRERRRRRGETALETDITPDTPLEIKERLVTDLFGDTPPVTAENLEDTPKGEVATHVLKDVFTYKDVLGEEVAGRIDMSLYRSAVPYAEKLAELIINPDTSPSLLEASEAIKRKFDSLAELVSEAGPLSRIVESNGWRYWDIAKQEVLKDDEYRTAAGELVSGSVVYNGDSDPEKSHTEFMRDVVALRHFAWELHNKYTLSGEDNTWIDDKISTETRLMLQKVGDLEHRGQLSSSEYVELGQSLERDLHAWKTSMELATMTDDEKIIALSGRLKVKVKVEGESKLFENATIVDTGTTDTGQKVYLVRYTDESGVLSDPIMVSAEAIKRRNLVSDDEE